MADARTAVVTALPEEARAIARALGVSAVSALAAEPAPLVVAWTGDGGSRASRNLSLLLNRVEPNRVIGAGVAGALTADLPPGSIARPSVAADETGNRVALAGGDSGTLVVSTGIPLFSSAEKRRFAEALALDRKAIADLETFAWAGVARVRKIPFSAVRIVLDGCDDDLPGFLEGAVRPDGSIHRRAVAFSAVLRPARIVQLLGLRRRFLDACTALAPAVAAALRQPA